MVTVAPTRYCAHPLCPNVTDGGYCAEHARAKEHRRFNFAWRRLYRAKKWKWTRMVVLREEPFCRDCEARNETTASSEVHHKQRPLCETEFYRRDNLMALCKPCHAVRTARGE